MASIVPSERLQRELQDLIAGVGEEGDPIEAIGRLGERLILQQALEEELSEFLGRERYERRGEPVAHRNGYERVSVKTTAGPLELERPRVRNASALGFCSEIVGKGVCRTHALEALVVCSFLRGLSVRDVEAALEEAFEGPVVSKSTVSRICASTRERVREAYFTGYGDPYGSLRKALRADIDEAAWTTLYTTESRPFPAPETGKIAVKVINHYGDEVMKVYDLSSQTIRLRT